MNEQNNNRSPESVAALVLGILSIVLSFFGYSSLIAITISIVGIILAIRGRKQTPNSYATAGLITSIIGLCLSGIFLAACVACLGGASIIGGIGIIFDLIK